MTTAERYDAILIGAGQANNSLSRALAQAGWSVALIERAHVGGTCVNEGCTPTKTMVASARVAHLTHRAPDYGVDTGPPTTDMTTVRERKRSIVESFRTGSRRRIEETPGVDLLMGEARFAGPRLVDVQLNDGSRRQLTAERLFINVGQRPRVPDLPGLRDVPSLNSTTIMELDVVPEHLLVLGGGYVGVEFAQMFRRFGSAVSVVQRSEQVLNQEDADVAAEVVSILNEDGIEVLLNSEALDVKEDAEGRIQLRVRTPEGDRVLSGSHLLVAVGRVPNTKRLNLAAAGIETDPRGYIQVDERLATSVPGVYALGDVTGGPAFTHMSYDDYRIIRNNLLDGGDATTTDRLVPYVVFIDPQLGGVGLTERQARKRGLEVQVAKMPMSRVARALEVDEPRGLMKVIVDGKTDRILGATILAVEGGEVMAILQTAMMGDLPYTVLRDAVFAHPTLAESLNNLFAMLGE
ncbi:MAG: mercuric reductase [Anaerolineae bacterium]|jgi:pyruvate/2-oxoglutarate dehydrogenase complex dihydrolipoamide dehydrogenase (E3) component